MNSCLVKEAPEGAVGSWPVFYLLVTVGKAMNRMLTASGSHVFGLLQPEAVNPENPCPYPCPSHREKARTGDRV
jgi:hypothetical protein